MYDIAIIGAGIIGSFLAHDLSKKDCKVIVFDKNADVADGSTMANSAIIHSGHDPKEGTLKAKLNVRGNRMYEEICEEIGAQFKRVSAFVAATSEEEESILEKLSLQAKKREIPYSVISGDEARKKEKNLSKSVTKVLELPSTGIIYPWEVAINLMEEAIINGVELRLEEEINAIEKEEDLFVLQTEKGSYEAKYVINAAGVYADKVYEMAIKKEAFFHITPRRGVYFVLDKSTDMLVNRVIYPVPGPNGKGVLVVPTTHGNILLGPDSLVVEDKDGINTTTDELNFVKENVCKTVKNIPFDKVIRTFAGLRPTGDTGDFVIEESKELKGFVNVACIESPGLASAPAISEYVICEVMKDEFSYPPRNEYHKRRKTICLKDMSDQEKNELVSKNPDFGQIICRCEQVSKGEILDVIHRPLGAKSVKGVKKRIRPGMGRCQGGFCEPSVVEILSQELNVSPLDITLDGENSVLLMEETKGGNGDA